jgi:hypothetical protein
MAGSSDLVELKGESPAAMLAKRTRPPWREQAQTRARAPRNGCARAADPPSSLEGRRRSFTRLRGFDPVKDVAPAADVEHSRRLRRQVARRKGRVSAVNRLVEPARETLEEHRALRPSEITRSFVPRLPKLFDPAHTQSS